jgi:hypothetical protein
MNKIIAHKHRIIVFSLLLFAVMQYSALLHASTHFFHTHDNTCSIYNAVDHSKAGVVNHDISLTVIPARLATSSHLQHIVTTAYYIFLPSRAPPRA